MFPCFCAVRSLGCDRYCLSQVVTLFPPFFHNSAALYWTLCSARSKLLLVENVESSQWAKLRKSRITYTCRIDSMEYGDIKLVTKLHSIQLHIFSYGKTDFAVTMMRNNKIAEPPSFFSKSGTYDFFFFIAATIVMLAFCETSQSCGCFKKLIIVYEPLNWETIKIATRAKKKKNS